MSNSYNFEELPKVKTAIEAIEEECSTGIPRLIELTKETAQALGSAKLVENANKAEEVLNALKETLLSLNGEAGDKLSEATLNGYYTQASKLDAIVNG